MSIADITRNRHQKSNIVEVQLQITWKGQTLLNNLWNSREVCKNLLLRLHIRTEHEHIFHARDFHSLHKYFKSRKKVTSRHISLGKSYK